MRYESFGSELLAWLWSRLKERLVQYLASQKMFWGWSTGSGTGLMSTAVQSVEFWKMATIVLILNGLYFWLLHTRRYFGSNVLRSVFLSTISIVCSLVMLVLTWLRLTLGQSCLSMRSYFGLFYWIQIWLGLTERCCPDSGFLEDGNLVSAYQKVFWSDVLILDQPDRTVSRVRPTRKRLFWS